jgi:hypothetical protein
MAKQFYDRYKGVVAGPAGMQWRVVLRRLQEGPPSEGVQPLRVSDEGFVFEQGDSGKDRLNHGVEPSRLHLRVADPDLEVYEMLRATPDQELRLQIASEPDGAYTWTLTPAPETLSRPYFLEEWGAYAFDFYAACGLKALEDVTADPRNDWQGTVEENLRRLREAPFRYERPQQAIIERRPVGWDDDAVVGAFPEGVSVRSIGAKAARSGDKEDLISAKEQLDRLTSMTDTRLHLGARDEWRVEQLRAVGRAFDEASRVASRKQGVQTWNYNSVPARQVAPAKHEIDAEATLTPPERLSSVEIKRDLSWAEEDMRSLVLDGGFERTDVTSWTGTGGYTTQSEHVRSGARAAKCREGQQLRQEVARLSSEEEISLYLTVRSRLRRGSGGTRRARIRLVGVDEETGTRYWWNEGVGWQDSESAVTVLEATLDDSNPTAGYDQSIVSTAPAPFTGPVDLVLLGPADSGDSSEPVAYYDDILCRLERPADDGSGRVPAQQWTSVYLYAPWGQTIEHERTYASVVLEPATQGVPPQLLVETEGADGLVCAFEDGPGGPRHKRVADLEAARARRLSEADLLEGTVRALCPLEYALLLPDGTRCVALSVKMNLALGTTEGRWLLL